MTPLRSILFLLVVCSNLSASAEQPRKIRSGETVLFLGDSITHSGGYIVELEARLRSLHPDKEFTLINLGLPSETCSGLSEPAHPFPRGGKRWEVLQHLYAQVLCSSCVVAVRQRPRLHQSIDS